MSAESTEGGAGTTDPSAAQSNRLRALDEERARLTDLLAAANRDLEARTKEVEAERTRVQELEGRLSGGRDGVRSAEQKARELEEELVAKNSELHRAQVESEQLLLRAQRAELHLEQDNRAERLEEGQRELGAEIETKHAQIDQLRVDKDEEIESLKEALHQARQGASEGATKVLIDLWDRLARATPKLVEGHVTPNVQAIERLVDAFIELVKFVDDLEKTLRIFLGKYTKNQPSVKVPWDSYAKSEEFYKTIQQIVAPKGGKPAGLAKMRLRVLYSWTEAAMIASDSAMESIASELETQLQGTLGMGDDPNRKIRDYVRADGHFMLMQHMRELRNKRLAETYGHSKERG